MISTDHPPCGILTRSDRRKCSVRSVEHAARGSCREVSARNFCCAHIRCCSARLLGKALECPLSSSKSAWRPCYSGEPGVAAVNWVRPNELGAVAAVCVASTECSCLEAKYWHSNLWVGSTARRGSAFIRLIGCGAVAPWSCLRGVELSAALIHKANNIGHMPALPVMPCVTNPFSRICVRVP